MDSYDMFVIFDNLVGIIFLCLLGLVALAIYLVPTIIVIFRKTTANLPIILINIFLGWTFIVWVACIIWAFVAKTKKEEELDTSIKLAMLNNQNNQNNSRYYY